ncbi:unnamed protein product [Dibothriocephalus latus]|uniref:AP complex subunit sigma n=1 Tax=Dibothriocephalus latus TaxID=60516 RepID=A0A3P7NXH4_DIBLA|nr:unnamed protein product [Dibothriocephalus latus]
MAIVLARKPKMSSFLEWKDMKLVYRRYASLYFLCAIEPEDNELLTLEVIHRYVEILDKYFGNVDEFLFAGEVQESGPRSIMSVIDAQDMLQEEEVPQSFFEDQSLN